MLHLQQGPAGGVHQEGLLVQGPLAVQHKAAPAGRGRPLAGLHRAGEHDLADLVGQMQLAVRDDEAADRRQLEGLAGLLGVQRPGLASVQVAQQVQAQGLKLHQGQVQPAHQQGQKLDLQPKLARLGHVAGTRPGRIADLQAADIHLGREGQQMRAQVAVDAHRAPGSG